VLIMLPGSLGNADIFDLQLLHLASRARCIAIDYPESPTAVLPPLISFLYRCRNTSLENICANMTHHGLVRLDAYRS
jgi:hypothetical protein